MSEKKASGKRTDGTGTRKSAKSTTTIDKRPPNEAVNRLIAERSAAVAKEA